MLSMRKLLITGATGTIGGEVVTQLLRGAHDVSPAGLRVMARDPERLTLPGDAEVVRGDFTEPESVESAAKGVDTVFLLWTAPPGAVAPAIEAIARSARRIVFLSSPHQTPHPFFQQPNPMAAMHADIERNIRSSGLQWTFVRPGIFAANAINWWGRQIREGEVVRWPYGEAATAPIHEIDIAAVVVEALLKDRLTGTDFVLTGPESLTQREQVLTIGEAVGKRLRFEEIAPEDTSTVFPAPPAALKMLLSAWSAAVGQPAWMTSAVQDILGRPARTFREWAADHVAAFRG
jgi:uncharacterized protein YbjT (DUF2867 family)